MSPEQAVVTLLGELRAMLAERDAEIERLRTENVRQRDAFAATLRNGGPPPDSPNGQADETPATLTAAP